MIRSSCFFIFDTLDTQSLWIERLTYVHIFHMLLLACFWGWFNWQLLHESPCMVLSCCNQSSHLQIWRSAVRFWFLAFPNHMLEFAWASHSTPRCLQMRPSVCDQGKSTVKLYRLSAVWVCVNAACNAKSLWVVNQTRKIKVKSQSQIYLYSTFHVQNNSKCFP